MAQTNYTPISLYYSTTASAVPTAANLVPGELAINTNDGKLYYEDSSGVVQVLASKATSSGTFTTISVSGVATFSAGTVSLPAITTTGDTNTGIFFPAADTIAFTEGGTESMRIDSGGNVGIGATPTNFGANFTVLDVYNGTTGGYILVRNPTHTGQVSVDGTGMAVQTRTNSPIQFITNNAERMRLDTSGNVLVGITTARTNAGDVQVSKGISFPATQSAQTDVNTLDDYEEGTFTPTIIGSTTAGTGTYTTQVGSYTKVGQAVSIQIRLSWTAHTGTGFMLVSGLPFTTLSGGVQPSFVVGDARDITLTALNILTLFSDTNTTTIQFIQTPVGGGASANVPIDTSATIILAGTYIV